MGGVWSQTLPSLELCPQWTIKQTDNRFKTRKQKTQDLFKLKSTNVTYMNTWMVSWF